MRRPARVTVVVAAALAGAAALSGAAAAPAARPAAICIPIPLLWSCDDDASSDPTPTPTPTDTSLVPGLDVPGTDDTGSGSESGSDSGDGDATAPTAEPSPTVDAVPDESAPVFTQPPAQLGSDSLSFTGLSGLSIVTVPLADGSRVAALKISADSITITGFALTVQGWTGASLATTADTMTLSGNVEVYLDSLTATTQSGQSLTLGADTPPPADGIEPLLLRVTFGLVGATADSISYTNTDQQLSE